MRRDWLRQGARQGAEAALKVLCADSLRRVPRDTGRLAASCRVEMEKGEARGRAVYDAPYALRQHEEKQARYPGGGGAGYLRGAAEDPGTLAAMERALAREAGRRL